MSYDPSPKVQALQQRLLAFMDQHIYPNEARWHHEMGELRAAGNPWQPVPVVDELKLEVKRADLAREVTWLPATEIHGEGVLLAFRREKLEAWRESMPEDSVPRILLRYFSYLCDAISITAQLQVIVAVVNTDGSSDGGELFMLACGVWVSCALLLWLRREVWLGWLARVTGR